MRASRSSLHSPPAPRAPRARALFGRRRRARRTGAAIFAPLLAGLLLAVAPVRAEDAARPVRLSDAYRSSARLEVPVREISGWAPLPSNDDDATRRFLAVVDEGTYGAKDRTVHGALHVLDFCLGEDGSIGLGSHREITLRLGDLIPRLDPMWANGGSLLDLEACVPMPGHADLFLLAGERNPEDATDGGANRLYVVRYPGRENDGAAPTEHADLLAYLRLPDLPDDTVNDRLEAVVVAPHDAAHAWRVFAFKERTQSTEHPPAYFPLLLRRLPSADEGGEAAFELGWAEGPRTPRRLPHLLPGRDDLGAQADACLDTAGGVWVLDRWRREIHVADVVAPVEGGLAHRITADVFDLIGDVPGSASAGEPGAPGSPHAGYGRHEAMTFDAHGWLWLAADLGGHGPSVVTVLVPRADGPALGDLKAHEED